MTDKIQDLFKIVRTMKNWFSLNFDFTGSYFLSLKIKFNLNLISTYNKIFLLINSIPLIILGKRTIQCKQPWS